MTPPQQEYEIQVRPARARDTYKRTDRGQVGEAQLPPVSESRVLRNQGANRAQGLQFDNRPELLVAAQGYQTRGQAARFFCGRVTAGGDEWVQKKLATLFGITLPDPPSTAQE